MNQRKKNQTSLGIIIILIKKLGIVFINFSLIFYADLLIIFKEYINMILMIIKKKDFITVIISDLKLIIVIIIISIVIKKI